MLHRFCVTFKVYSCFMYSAATDPDVIVAEMLVMQKMHLFPAQTKRLVNSYASGHETASNVQNVPHVSRIRGKVRVGDFESGQS